MLLATVYTTFPTLNEAILKANISANVLAAWYALRNHTAVTGSANWRNSPNHHGGHPGAFTKVEAAEIIGKQLGISKCNVWKLFPKGEGVFWETYKAGEYSKIRIIGLTRVLQFFNVGYSPAKEYEIAFLKGTCQERRAHFYITTITKNPPGRPGHNAKPLSRDTIKERTNCNKETQRKYEEMLNVDKQFNWACMETFTDQEFDEVVNHYGKGIPEQLVYRINIATKGEGLGTRYHVKIIDNQPGIWRQLPNSYSDLADKTKNPLSAKLRAQRRKAHNTTFDGGLGVLKAEAKHFYVFATKSRGYQQGAVAQRCFGEEWYKIQKLMPKVNGCRTGIWITGTANYITQVLPHSAM